MEDNVLTLTNETNELLTQIKQWSEDFSKLVPVTFESKIKWYGGLPGAIIEIREEKRRAKLMNTPIIGDFTFWTLSFEIMEKVQTLGEKTRELQSILTDSHPDYLKIGDDVLNSVYSLIENWKNYSPSLARTNVDFGEGKKKNVLSLLEKILHDAAIGCNAIAASPETISHFTHISRLLL